jgi:hypothetical protein
LVFQTILNYIAFVKKNKVNYFIFNKQLVFSEIAGLISGLIVAEMFYSLSKASNSFYSGITDYIFSIVFFLIIYYYDNKKNYQHYKYYNRIKKILKSAISFWPSIIIADIAYLIARPYIHYMLISLFGLETGLAATIAHFFAFGLFNIIAILSKSIIDFVKD